MLKWIAGILIVIVTIAGLVVFKILPERLDAKMNAVIAHEPYTISDRARSLHETIPVADLHADTLLWMRDPAQRQSRGQTDLPRLIEGGTRLQVFTAVTKSPRGLNYEENAANAPDDIKLLAMVQRWPFATWNSIYERAAYQARRMRDLDQRTGDTFFMVETSAELQSALDSGALAGVFGIEGAHPLEGDIANIDRLYDEGLRVIGLQHFFDNELGGSLHGQTGAGLTEFGREVVRRANEKEMIIDVAHSSEAVVKGVLALSSRPLIVSHTGLKGHCDTPRNIADETMVAIAQAGGLIGVGYWDGAICQPDVETIAEAILYAVELLGADHVALGSDFDGTVTTPVDASELPALTQALMDAGASDDIIRQVMGENAVRFFLENLPAS